MKKTKVIGAVSAAALALGLMGSAVAPAAAASGPESNYLVLAPQGKSTAQAAARVAAAGGTVVAAYNQIGVLVVRSANAGFAGAVAGSGVESVASTQGLGTTLIDDEIVETLDSATVDATGDPTAEPLWSRQWDMAQIDVPAAHAVTTGDPSIVVGVLDSGIDATHPDLATQVAKDKSASCIGGVVDTNQAAWSPTTSTHGTHVAGTIAAAINGVGIAGVAPGVKVASVKVVNDDGFIFPEAAICGYLWAADQGMPITNNSYFIDPWEFNCRNDARQRPVWQAVQRAIRYSAAQGTLTVASAGNSNVDLQHKFIDAGSPNDGSAPIEEREINNACLDLPAEAPGVVTVSAVGPGEVKSYYSSYGQGVVDVTAPGGDTRWRNPAVVDDHRRRAVHGSRRMGILAGHLDGRTARGRCRGTRALGAPGPQAGRPRVDARAHGRAAAVPRGRVRPAPGPGLPGDVHRRPAQRVLRSRQRQRAERRAVTA